jgi:hypothetical protein
VSRWCGSPSGRVWVRVRSLVSFRRGTRSVGRHGCLWRRSSRRCDVWWLPARARAHRREGGGLCGAGPVGLGPVAGVRRARPAVSRGVCDPWPYSAGVACRLQSSPLPATSYTGPERPCPASGVRRSCHAVRLMMPRPPGCGTGVPARPSVRSGDRARLPRGADHARRVFHPDAARSGCHVPHSERCGSPTRSGSTRSVRGGRDDADVPGGAGDHLRGAARRLHQGRGPVPPGNKITVDVPDGA